MLLSRTLKAYLTFFFIRFLRKDNIIICERCQADSPGDPSPFHYRMSLQRQWKYKLSPPICFNPSGGPPLFCVMLG
uniref:Uncharacterized protein n=1 Tax=Pelusios castaneus TaxID=367368 RepID=A0A8C8R5H9_9SAUR